MCSEGNCQLFGQSTGPSHAARILKTREENKKGGPFPIGPPSFVWSLEAGDVRCLQTLRSTGYFEFNRLAFVQRFVPFRLNRGKVDENVLAGLALDESESLAGIEPLDCSL